MQFFQQLSNTTTENKTKQKQKHPQQIANSKNIEDEDSDTCSTKTTEMNCQHSHAITYENNSSRRCHLDNKNDNSAAIQTRTVRQPGVIHTNNDESQKL